MRKLFSTLTLILLLATPWSAAALPFSSVITEGTVGSGANEAMIVVDWDDGTTPSHAWLYRWSGAATFAIAFDAIQAAFPTFAWSGGSFVQFIDYDDGVDAHETTNAGWLSFWESSDGESWSTTLLGVTDQLLVDGGWAGANANLPVDGFPGDAPSVPVPEPAAGLLVGLGLVGMAGWRRRSAA